LYLIIARYMQFWKLYCQFAVYTDTIWIWVQESYDAIVSTVFAMVLCLVFIVTNYRIMSGIVSLVSFMAQLCRSILFKQV